MAKIKYTYEQRKAIEHEGNVIVSAGAGSGKTQVLTERVLYFINQIATGKLDLDEFLILTFTKLAAGEMKDRIRKTLIKNKCDAAAAKVDTANICTFDSYALSLVKKYHFLLNVSPDISIIDSSIISVRKRTIINDIFEEYYKKEDPKLCKMVDKFCYKNDEDLKKLAYDLYEKALTSGNSKAYLENYIDKYFAENFLKDLLEERIKNDRELKKQLEDVVKILPITGVKYNDIKGVPFNEAWEDILSDFFNAETYDEIMATSPALGTSNPTLTAKPGNEDDIAIKNKLFDLKNEIKKDLSKLPKSFEDFKNKMAENKDTAEVLIEIVKELDKRLVAYKNKYQVYEFSDIAKMALDLVRQHDDIRDSIKNSLKMIMIDEYQDTSEFQENFINEIANNNVYSVGDVKQSIYRFRNARCDLFMKKYDDYKTKSLGTAIDLNTNFRSRKEVLSDINYIFKNLMTLEEGGADYRNSHMILYGNEDYIKYGIKKSEETSSSINHTTVLYSDFIKDDMPETEASIIATDIINKLNSHYQVYDRNIKGLRDCKFSDFCILIDRGTEFSTYAKVFEKFGLPLHIEYDENIMELDMVLVLRNLLYVLKFLQFKANGIEDDYLEQVFKNSFVGLLRSFIYNYSDEDIYNMCKKNLYYSNKDYLKIETAYKTYSKYPLDKQLEYIIRDLKFYERLPLSGQPIRNEQYLDKFINLFKQMSKLDYSLDDFINYIEYIDEYKLKLVFPAISTDLDSIKLMNIHKSKGLEFGIVYFSGLSKQFYTKDLDDGFQVSDKYGLVLKPDIKDEEDIVKTLNKIYENKEDTSEKIRLFYVALTRTKEKMILLIKDTNLLKEYFSKTYNLNTITKKETSFNIIDLLERNIIAKETADQMFKVYNLPLKDDYDKYNAISYFKKLDKRINDYVLTVDSIEDTFRYFISENLIGNISDEELIYIKEYLGVTIPKYIDKKHPLSEKEVIAKVKLDVLKDEDINCNIEKYKNVHEANLKYYDFLYRGFDKVIEEKIELPEYVEFIKFLGYTVDEAKLAKNNIEDFDVDSFIDEFISDTQDSESSIYDEIEFKENLKSLDIDKYVLYFYTAYGVIPMDKKLVDVKNYIFDNKNDSFNIDLYVKLFRILGYELTEYTKEYLKDINDGKKFGYKELDEKKYKDVYIPVSNLKEIENEYSLKYLFNCLIDLCINGKITKDECNSLLDIYNYELDNNFMIYNDYATLKKYDYKNNILDLVSVKNVERIVETKEDEEIKSLEQMVKPYLDNPVFEHKLGVIDETTKCNQIITSDYDDEKFNIKELNVEVKEKVIKRASKNLTLGSSREVMDAGTKLHFIMESTDFSNPDLDELGEDAKYVIDFLTKFEKEFKLKVTDAEIYKEYAFFDEKHNTNGFIDLMLVFDSCIYIIDYKTKNIKDEKYDVQLQVYRNFVAEKFKTKKIYTYLYSLMDNEFRPTKEVDI